MIAASNERTKDSDAQHDLFIPVWLTSLNTKNGVTRQLAGNIFIKSNKAW